MGGGAGERFDQSVGKARGMMSGPPNHPTQLHGASARAAGQKQQETCFAVLRRVPPRHSRGNHQSNLLVPLPGHSHTRLLAHLWAAQEGRGSRPHTSEPQGSLLDKRYPHTLAQHLLTTAKGATCSAGADSSRPKSLPYKPRRSGPPTAAGERETSIVSPLPAAAFAPAPRPMHHPCSPQCTSCREA
jgi:hypothetical protein